MDTYNKPPKLMDRVKATMRVKRYSPRPEKTYCWIRCFIRFHGVRIPLGGCLAFRHATARDCRSSTSPPGGFRPPTRYYRTMLLSDSKHCCKLTLPNKASAGAVAS